MPPGLQVMLLWLALVPLVAGVGDRSKSMYWWTGKSTGSPLFFGQFMVCGRFSRKPIWQRGFHGRTRVTRWKINESEVLITENDPFFQVNMGGVLYFCFFCGIQFLEKFVSMEFGWPSANDRRPSGRVPCHLWCWQYWHAALCVPRWIFCCGLEKVEENQLT